MLLRTDIRLFAATIYAKSPCRGNYPCIVVYVPRALLVQRNVLRLGKFSWLPKWKRPGEEWRGQTDSSFSFQRLEKKTQQIKLANARVLFILSEYDKEMHVHQLCVPRLIMLFGSNYWLGFWRIVNFTSPIVLVRRSRILRARLRPKRLISL